MDLQNREFEDLPYLHMVEACLDARLAAAILSKVQDEQLKPRPLRDLLIMLLNYDLPEAQSLAEGIVQLRASSETAYQRAIIAACVLLTHTSDASWSMLWPVFQQDAAFGQKVFLTLQHFPTGKEPLKQRLTEEQAGEFFIWLVQQFPPEEDPPPPNGPVAERWKVSEMRNDLIISLQQRATPQACTVLHKIIQVYPDQQWIRWQLHDAEKRLRERTWQPPTPGAILKLAENMAARLVQSGAQLLDVLIESLTRLQEELQGETPSYQDLWNGWGPKKKKLYRPKDENELSNYVKRFLDRDLVGRVIIANREVELRPSTGGNPGERTDIHVDAFLPNHRGEPASTLTAIIEVKGCWHEELFQAMETQLVDRYLKENPCRYGLYLVGWFNCKQWDPADYRKSDAPTLDIEEAREKFAAQAIHLSADPIRDVLIRSFVLNTVMR